MSKPVTVRDIIKQPDLFKLVPLFDHGAFQGFMVKPNMQEAA